MKYSLNKRQNSNLLPRHGFAYYNSNFFNNSGNKLFQQLAKEINWKHDELTLYGKKIITKRQVAFEGDENIEYTYSKQKKTTSPWSKSVLEIKHKIEDELGLIFNASLLNFYPNGEVGMAWHSDNEPELEPNGMILSLSFGAPRTLQFKHKQTGEKIDIKLENGSLLLMDMESQQYWLHQLKKEAKIKDPRINLTFRQFKK